ELVLEADHIAGAIVGDVCSPPAGIRDLVVDDVDNASVLSGVLMELLYCENSRYGLAGCQIHSIGRVFCKGRQPALFRRIR
ncbi:MAG: hypothetical protein ACK46M_26335, partial [Planctomyces sp.]